MSRDMLRTMAQQTGPDAAAAEVAAGSRPAAAEVAAGGRQAAGAGPVAGGGQAAGGEQAATTGRPTLADARYGAASGDLHDEVDDLVAGWRAERPDLDVEPLQVLSRVSRLARHLDRARRAAFTAHALESWEFDVLSALRRQGPPYQLSPGALLRATLVTSGTMTNRIDRLASAGLVSRHPDPQDKRGVLVVLTDRGRAAADAALADLLLGERELLTGLDSAQRSQLAGLLRILLAPFDASDASQGTEQPRW